MSSKEKWTWSYQKSEVFNQHGLNESYKWNYIWRLHFSFWINWPELVTQLFARNPKQDWENEGTTHKTPLMFLAKNFQAQIQTACPLWLHLATCTCHTTISLAQFQGTFSLLLSGPPNPVGNPLLCGVPLQKKCPG